MQTINKKEILELVKKHFSMSRKHLIDTNTLAKLIESKAKNIRILDCTSLLPNDTRDVNELFKRDRIPSSQFFNVDEISDKSQNLPHMLPNEQTFIDYMKIMDIRKNDQIICYDRLGMFSAPRVWFNFMVFGAKNVMVLNGGFPKWINESFPLELGDLSFDPNIRGLANAEDFDYKLDTEKIRNLANVLQLSDKILRKLTDEHLIDARSNPRFKGEVDEPRPVKRRGNIEGAQNVFFKDLLDEKSCFKSNKELKRVFEDQGINIDNPITYYCGSGVTACNGIFALALLDKFNNCRLYDGSWAEYGNLSVEDIDIKRRQSINM